MKITMDSPLDQRYEHLYNVISSPKFLEMEGLGKEVPFFICPFSPKETKEMMDAVQGLKRQLELKGIRVLLINLYDLSIEIMQAHGIWERILNSESELSKPVLREMLQNVLDPEKYLIPGITDQIEGRFFDVLFLTGIGEVFPYIRSHTVLNNLQSKVKDFPTVMFYPGNYILSAEGGTFLELFGRLHDANYYRAFNIYERQK